MLIIKAAALIVGPILCGALLFLALAPSNAPGVYLGTDRGAYALPTYASGTTPSFASASRQPSAPATNGAVSFFIVAPEHSPLAANAAAAKLHFFVVDHADGQFRSALVPVPATVRRVNPRVYHITSNELAGWRPDGLAYRSFQKVLESAGSPTTKELMIGLAIPESPEGTQRFYAVRFGP